MINLIPARMIEQLKFQVYEPCVQLKPWLQCLWSIDTSGSLTFSSSKFYPEGGATLRITLSSADPLIHVILNKHTYQETVNNQYPMIGIRFNPSGIYTLLGLNLSPYTNLFIRLGEELSPLWYASLTQLIETMPWSNFPLCVQLLQTWLLTLVTQPNCHNKALALAKTVQTSNLPIQDLATSLGLTKRTLERRLKNESGFSPKELISIRRLQQARLLLCHSGSDLSDIATQCGYFDQAHFTHSFKQLTAETPSGYRKRKLSQNYNI
mgnify:CR=1 FL=1